MAWNEDLNMASNCLLVDPFRRSLFNASHRFHYVQDFSPPQLHPVAHRLLDLSGIAHHSSILVCLASPGVHQSPDSHTGGCRARDIADVDGERVEGPRREERDCCSSMPTVQEKLENGVVVHQAHSPGPVRRRSKNTLLGELVREVRVVKAADVAAIDPDTGTSGRVDTSADELSRHRRANGEVGSTAQEAGGETGNVGFKVDCS